MSSERITELARLAVSAEPAGRRRAEWAIATMPPAVLRAVLVEALLLVARAEA